MRNGSRIVIRGRLPKHASKVQDLFGSLRTYGFKVIMYTGAWGGVDVTANRTLLDWVQKDKDGKPLGYRASLRSGMLCPASPYTEQILIPEIVEILSKCPFHTLFFDIPWIMRGGCHCEWCREPREKNGLTNSGIVKETLSSVIERIHQQVPNVTFAVNAGAPGLNNDDWTGAPIRNLAGIFDEYVTEWNPYRWGQNANVIADSISKAKQITTGKFSHASTLTNRSSELLSTGAMRRLFAAILSSGADPWLSINFSTKKLDKIHEAYLVAQDETGNRIR